MEALEHMGGQQQLKAIKPIQLVQLIRREVTKLVCQKVKSDNNSKRKNMVAELHLIGTRHWKKWKIYQLQS